MASVESRKQRLEANNKTVVCREFSWQQKLGLKLIHLGETLLGLSLLVTGRDLRL